MPGRIVCVGECMVEMAPLGEGLTDYRQGFAGDTFNTAWYLRHCLPDDWSIDYLSAVGQDALSDRLIGFMKAAGIGTDHVARLTPETLGLYLITLDNGERSFAYWRGQSAARRLAEDKARLTTALVGAGAVVLSGITLAILDPDQRARLLRALIVAREAGAIVVFDPNMRQRLWSDVDTMRTMVNRMAAQADMVLPSFDEDREVFGDADPVATMARYRALGVKVVVVKNGRGRIWGWDGAVCSFNPPIVTPIDTTAAGDSFNAGFLAACLTGADLPAAIAIGARVAEQVIQRPGALVPIIS